MAHVVCCQVFIPCVTHHGVARVRRKLSLPNTPPSLADLRQPPARPNNSRRSGNPFATEGGELQCIAINCPLHVAYMLQGVRTALTAFKPCPYFLHGHSFCPPTSARAERLGQNGVQSLFRILSALKYCVYLRITLSALSTSPLVLE